MHVVGLKVSIYFCLQLCQVLRSALDRIPNLKELGKKAFLECGESAALGRLAVGASMCHRGHSHLSASYFVMTSAAHRCPAVRLDFDQVKH